MFITFSVHSRFAFGPRVTSVGPALGRRLPGSGAIDVACLIGGKKCDDIGDFGGLRVATERHETAEVIVEALQVGPWSCKPIKARSNGCARAYYVHPDSTPLQFEYPRAEEDTLWPEYVELQAAALHSYLNEATERIIQEEVYGDSGEAKERAG